MYMVCKQDVTKKYKGNMVTCRIAAGLKKKNLNGPGYRVATKLKINIFLRDGNGSARSGESRKRLYLLKLVKTFFYMPSIFLPCRAERRLG